MNVRETLILAATLCGAALTRLYRLDLIWFTLDQIRDVSVGALSAVPSFARSSTT